MEMINRFYLWEVPLLRILPLAGSKKLTIPVSPRFLEGAGGYVYPCTRWKILNKFRKSQEKHNNHEIVIHNQIYGTAIKPTRHHTSFYSLYNTENVERTEVSES